MGDSNCNIDLVETTIQNETLLHVNLPERRILPQTGLTTVREKNTADHQTISNKRPVTHTHSMQEGLCVENEIFFSKQEKVLWLKKYI